MINVKIRNRFLLLRFPLPGKLCQNFILDNIVLENILAKNHEWHLYAFVQQ